MRFFDILYRVKGKITISVLQRFGRFSLSSLFGFVVDNLVFTIVLMALQAQNMLRRHDILIALATARAVSATLNYVVNKRFVFKSRASVSSSFTRYWVLVLLIAALSYAGTAVLSYVLDLRGAVITVCKIVVETVLFIISYKLQRIWVF